MIRLPCGEIWVEWASVALIKHFVIACLMLAGTLSCSGAGSLPDGILGQPYRATVPGIAGQDLLHWAVTSGALPDGLSRSSRTGEISGTPTKAGKFEFTVRITDSATPPQKTLKKLSIRILATAAGGTPPSTGHIWKGTMRSETTANNGTYGTCTGETWDMQLRLAVDTDGSVKGDARGRLMSMPQCSGASALAYEPQHQARNATYDVLGEFDGQRFKLQFAQTSFDGKTAGLLNYSLGIGPDFAPSPSPMLVVPVTSAATAQGEAVTNVPVPNSAGFVASGRHSFDLKCEACAPR